MPNGSPEEEKNQEELEDAQARQRRMMMEIAKQKAAQAAKQAAKKAAAAATKALYQAVVRSTIWVLGTLFGSIGGTIILVIIGIILIIVIVAVILYYCYQNPWTCAKWLGFKGTWEALKVLIKYWVWGT